MTPTECKAQRDMVVRSLFVSLIRSERSEERPRKRVNRPVLPVIVDTPVHVFVMPVVNERKPL